MTVDGSGFLTTVDPQGTHDFTSITASPEGFRPDRLGPARLVRVVYSPVFGLLVATTQGEVSLPANRVQANWRV